jgi:hypothetical protein
MEDDDEEEEETAEETNEQFMLIPVLYRGIVRQTQIYQGLDKLIYSTAFGTLWRSRAFFNICTGEMRFQFQFPFSMCRRRRSAIMTRLSIMIYWQ